MSVTSAANPDLVDRLREHMSAAADPGRAAAMRAYMRDQFPFLGLPSASVQASVRAALAQRRKPDEAELREIALTLWALPEREYQYAACALLRRFVTVCGPGFLDTVRHLIVTSSWWDTVDTLASNTVGPLVRLHPSLTRDLDEWIDDDNVWLARTALLHQLGYKGHTDVERLFRYCLRRADHPDFFMRKAIGWALRQYAWTDPQAVRAFVRANEAALSSLSKREALKNIA